MESDSLMIRKLNSDDLPQFSELFNQMLENDMPDLHVFVDRLKSDYSDTVLLTVINSSRYTIFGAFVEDKLIGFIWGNSVYYGLGFISWIMVNKNYRNRGIASKLMKYYEDYVKSRGGHVVELYCFQQILDFYIKRGYHKIGMRPKGYFGLRQYILNKLF